MDIKKYKPGDEKIWDSMIPETNNGTLFHTRQFFKYHPEDRFKDHSLIFLKNGKIRALFPAAEKNHEKERNLVSHPGSSFGSFVVPEDLSFKESEDMVVALVNYARKTGFTKIQITSPPVLYSHRPSNYIDFALMKSGFEYQTREVTSVLFLEETILKTEAKFRASHRQAVRKAEKQGIVVSLSNDYKTFYSILKKNLKIRHGVQPTHTLDEILLLKKLFPDHIQLWGAFHGSEMVAGVINFICNERAILAFYISHNEDYQEFRPVNLLFYTIFDWAIKKNYKVFDFGIFTVKEKPNYGLGRFKENFGASGIFRDTMVLSL